MNKHGMRKANLALAVLGMVAWVAMLWFLSGGVIAP